MQAEALRIGVLHGPNLNLLGRRETERYGRRSLERIESDLRERAREVGAAIVSFQSNSEGALVDWVHEHARDTDGWLVNAAAYTHTSVALRDALAAAGRPFVEVHLSNVFAREDFRGRSLVSPACRGGVWGFGPHSYTAALHALLAVLGDG